MAIFMHASRLKIIDDIKRDKVFLQFPFFYGLFAERAIFLEIGPVFDANIAKSMTI